MAEQLHKEQRHQRTKKGKSDDTIRTYTKRFIFFDVFCSILSSSISRMDDGCLVDGQGLAVPLLEALQHGVDELALVDADEHLVALLAGGLELLASEVHAAELLTDEAVHGERPALLDPVGDGRGAVLHGHAGGLAHLPHRRRPATAACRLPNDGSPIHVMDPSAPEAAPPRSAAGEEVELAGRSRRRPGTVVRGVLVVAFPIAVSFLFSFLVGLAGLALGGLSSTASVFMPSTCRILSTGVDLRSSKVCDLGLLNYRAKHVFYPSSNRRFRCQDDYYWASVFQVEYTEYFSGQISYAVAEAPKEALPHNCRPDFGASWSTTLKFKVNESYSCRYTLGSSKADIYSDKLFNCTAEEPSTSEMLKRIFILFSKSYMSEDFSSGRMLGYVAAGIVAGMLSSMFITVLLRSFGGVFLAAARWAVSKHSIRVFAYRFKRACLLVAYVSVVGWITLQYSKMIGLKELLLDCEFMERFL